MNTTRSNNLGVALTCAVTKTEVCRGCWALAMLMFAGWQPTFAEVEPEWSSDREHRILVEVPPLADLPRSSDELIADAEINFDDYLPGKRADLGSLQVVAYSESTGEALDYAENSQSTTRGDRPLRFYDSTIPWDVQDPEGYAQNSGGKGTPARDMPGGLRFFNATGDGRKGRLAWAHTQTGDEPTRYAIYFNEMESEAAPKAVPAGFIGDGVNRCEQKSSAFAPVYQGRVGVTDLNGDGLPDLLMGNATGTILWYPNLGSKDKPQFDQPQLLLTKDGRAVDVGWSSAPVTMDWDGDGDFDLLIGAEKACVVHYENVGDVKKPVFQLVGLVNADNEILQIPRAPCEEDPENKIYIVDYYGVPELADWDGDGDLDLLIGGYITGKVWFYENTAAPGEGPPNFAFRGALKADDRDLDVSWCASPAAVDLDSDGDLDLVSGSMLINEIGGDSGSPDKFLFYFENVGSRTEPKLVRRDFPVKGKFAFQSLGTPRAVDFDADGLTDLVVSVNGYLLMLKNIGSKEAPLFDGATATTESKWGNGNLGFNQLVDFNADGRPDLFSGLSNIRLNTGDGAPGIFGPSLPLHGAEKILHPSPSGDHWDYRTMADVDNDGAMDILLGDHQGYVWFHRNLGTNEKSNFDATGVKLELVDGKPVQVGKPPANVAAFDVLQGARTAVTAGDFNRDGKNDVAVGDTFGYLRVYLQHAGTKPTFELATEVAKLEPTRMTVQRADWNGDGWDDLVASYANDRLYVLENAASKDGLAFRPPQRLKVPPCYGDPWPHVADWNHDGDDDLIIDQYGYTRFVERSFIDHGYRRAQVLKHEQRPAAAVQ